MRPAQSQDSGFKEHPPLKGVVLLSLGAGTSLVYIEEKDFDRGYAQWAKQLISMMLDGAAGIADYQRKQILGDSYHRLAPVFPPSVSIPLDAVDRIPYMIEFAESSKRVNLTATVKWLKRYWM